MILIGISMMIRTIQVLSHFIDELWWLFPLLLLLLLILMILNWCGRVLVLFPMLLLIIVGRYLIPSFHSMTTIYSIVDWHCCWWLLITLLFRWCYDVIPLTFSLVLLFPERLPHSQALLWHSPVLIPIWAVPSPTWRWALLPCCTKIVFPFDPVWYPGERPLLTDIAFSNIDDDWYCYWWLLIVIHCGICWRWYVVILLLTLLVFGMMTCWPHCYCRWHWRIVDILLIWLSWYVLVIPFWWPDLMLIGRRPWPPFEPTLLLIPTLLIYSLKAILLTSTSIYSDIVVGNQYSLLSTVLVLFLLLTVTLLTLLWSWFDLIWSVVIHSSIDTVMLLIRLWYLFFILTVDIYGIPKHSCCYLHFDIQIYLCCWYSVTLLTLLLLLVICYWLTFPFLLMTLLLHLHLLFLLLLLFGTLFDTFYLLFGGIVVLTIVIVLKWYDIDRRHWYPLMTILTALPVTGIILFGDCYRYSLLLTIHSIDYSMLDPTDII